MFTILVLDDMKDRHDAYDAWYKDSRVVHAYTLPEFQAALVERFDVIALDHDICDHGELPWEVFGHKSNGERNGKHAARLVVELPWELRPGQVIIHTRQPAGQDMLQILSDGQVLAIWVPFSPYK